MAKELTAAQLEKQMNKSFLGQAYRAIEDLAMRERILARYAQLMKENPQKNREVARNMSRAILPAIALRQVMLEEGIDRRESYRTIRSSVLASAESSKKFFSGLEKLPFFWGLVGWLCKMSMPASLAESNWRFEWIESDESCIHWNCLQCITKDTFDRYGFSELTPIFCERDDLVYSDLSSMSWARTKTMGRGGDFCDFRFYRKR